MLEETGWIASRNKDTGDFSFTPWKFTGTKTSDNGEVFFTAQNVSGKNTGDLLSSQPENRQLLFSLIRTFENARKQNIPLPCCGPEGILYDSKTDSFVFSPEKNYDRCAANLGKKLYDEFQDSWRDSLLSGSAALSFTASVFAYFALTGNKPYPEEAKTEKSVKICERNFLPVEYAINGINTSLAAAIDTNLSAEEKKLPVPLDELETELFKHESEKHQVPPEDFEKKVKAFVLRQQKKINRRHMFNRWIYTGIAAFAGLLFVLIATASIFLEHNRKPSVRGLDDLQVVKVFYAGIHHMDTDYMAAAEKDCPAAKRYIMQIPQIYVSTQMKSAYNFDSGISTPENWLFFEPDTKKSYSHFVFGITNFTVDGEMSTLNEKAPLRRDRLPKLLKKSDGTRLYSGEETNHSVRYYLVHTVGEELIIDEYTTELTLTFTDDRWQITAMNERCVTTSAGLLDFSLDYKKSLSRNNGNELSATEELRSKYNWLPYKKSIEEEKERLDAIGY